MTISSIAPALSASLNGQFAARIDAAPAEASQVEKHAVRDDYSALVAPAAMDASMLAARAAYDCRKTGDTGPEFDRMAMIEAGFDHIKSLFQAMQAPAEAQLSKSA